MKIGIRRRLRKWKIKILRLKPGAYCLVCKRYFTFEEWDELETKRIYPQYIATQTICTCGAIGKWKYIG